MNHRIAGRVSVVAVLAIVAFATLLPVKFHAATASAAMRPAAFAAPAVFRAPLQIKNTSPPNGIVGLGYHHQFSVSGGSGRKTFAVTGGALPPGLTLNANTGVISGRPTTAGTYANIVVTVTDATGATDDSPQMTIDVAAQSFGLGASRGPKFSREANDLTRQTGNDPMNLTLVVQFTVNGGAVMTVNLALTIPARARSGAVCTAIRNAVTGNATLAANFTFSDCFSTAIGDSFNVTPNAGVSLTDFPYFQAPPRGEPSSRRANQLRIDIYRP